MKTEDIKKMAQAWQSVQEASKKKLDPVDQDELKGSYADRKDKDIDNDGDADKSDEYLHNRRKAVSKAIKGKDTEVKMNPKAEQKEETELDEVNDEARIQRSLSAYKVKQDAKVKAGIPLRRPGESLAAYVTRKSKAQAKMQKESALPRVYSRILENRAAHIKGAVPADPMDKGQSPGGKKMKSDLGQSVNNDDKKGADDAAKAGRVTSKAAGRSGDNAAGDKSVVNPVKDTTK